MTKYHAERLTELDIIFIRLAWDHSRTEQKYMRALDLLHHAGIPKSKIRTYVMIGYKDTPEDALYRLQTLKDMGLWPNPMRYQPLDSERRNGYIAPNWTEPELKDFMRYWSKLRWLASVPFEEYTIPKKG